jgi:hypothetical protein
VKKAVVRIYLFALITVWGSAAALGFSPELTRLVITVI